VCAGPAGHGTEPPEPAVDAGGWFRTGDVGRIDPDYGDLAIVGRLKELIITGGLNVYPREVEAALEQVPGVVAAAVVGAPSRRWGEEVTAFVVRRPGTPLAVEQIEAQLGSVLASYKRPKHYRFVDDLPRNALGKLQRAELAARLAAGGDAEPSR
jgi:malonyl-CoA/methylmalonyl-CoA synthetase